MILSVANEYPALVKQSNVDCQLVMLIRISGLRMHYSNCQDSQATQDLGAALAYHHCP